jgi:hypothetical protein
MNCETVANNLGKVVAGELSAIELAECKQHIARCADCRDALRGTEALHLLRNRDTGEAPAGLFDAISAGVDAASGGRRGSRGFWLGAGFGGAIAASLLAVALTLGWLAPPTAPVAGLAEFTVSATEPRNVDLAIETDRPLQGATISIVLAGNIELDGYSAQRELSWTADLEAGVNRLSLPVRAMDASGGQMMVRLEHPDSRQAFVIQVKAGA